MPAAKTNNKRVSKKKEAKKFTIDCTLPANEGVFDTAAFETFLHDRIKVNGKTGNLANKVTIARDGVKIVVTADGIVFPKRYLKYLTKKFLKKKEIRDFMRVVAAGPSVYELKFFNINDDAEEEAE